MIQKNIFYEMDKKNNPDHVATPRYVVEDIYDLIDISSFKMKYKATHIFDDCGNDFFKTLPPENCDLLISNPPFGQQNDIIKRTVELIDKGLIKSFCLLLPLSTLETTTRAEMYEKYIDKLSIIIFKKRIKFLGKKTSFNKGCCWICYNIPKLKRQLYWIWGV